MITRKTITGKSISIAALVVLVLLFISATDISFAGKKTASTNTSSVNASVYTKLHLNELGLSEKVFKLGLNGLEKLKAKGAVSKNILSICDFTQSSNNKRLYVIDLQAGTLLFNTLVAHGKNTGEEFARTFSNQPSSYQSSLGFFTTKNTYTGEHGLSLKLGGMEPGFNNEAENRAIVMHGADYVSDTFINRFGRLGRSFGCPSVPIELHEAIINTIKDGTCLFIYYPDKKYLSASKLARD